MKNYRFDTIINFILFLYILSLYIFTFDEGLHVISNIIAGMFVVSVVVRILLLTRKIYVNSFIIVFFIFIAICLISGFYAVNQELVFIKVQTLFLIFIFIFFFINYIDTQEKFLKVINYFIYSGFIASIYILLTTDVTSGVRVGSELGNVNAIGLIISISFLFAFWKIIYEKSYIKLFLLVPMITTILLTGSRKSFIFVIVCLLLTYYFKNRSRLTTQIKVLCVSVFIIVISYFIVMEVPLFYQVLGVRMEGLVSFFTNVGTPDASMTTRSQMISFGMEAFKERPVLGYGISNYRELYGLEYLTPMYAHNNFVELLVGVGIVGTCIYYFSNIVVLKNFYRIDKNWKYITLYYTLFSVIISYGFLGLSLVYFDSKHFSILLALGSVVYRLYFTNKENSKIK